jgi:flavin-dependent dehydrogenase
MSRLADVAVVGGGPAGLAAAIAAAGRGFSVVVIERRGWPQDKACGEGLMPSGLHALERLGVRALLDPAECAPIVGVRYVQEDGSVADAHFPKESGGGLGIRRLALSAALLRRAREAGVELRAGAQARGVVRRSDRIEVVLEEGDPIAARLVVAADGLASPLRRAEGLELPPNGPQRFGVRRHYRRPAWSPFVEVHFADGFEAYVTPAGAERVGVAFLWDARSAGPPGSFPSLVDRFPSLRGQLAGVTPDSEPRGAGPLRRRARARTADRLVLLGDAGGYVDAITGEGLSLAFSCAEALAAVLPKALAEGATRASLRGYERAFSRAFRRYALLAGGLVLLTRFPAARRRLVRLLGHHPRTFSRILHWATREPALADPAARRELALTTSLERD